MAIILISMPRDFNPMTRTRLTIKTDSLHHILLKIGLTTNPTKIQEITAATQDTLVLVPGQGHLLEAGLEIPRIDRVGIIGADPEMEIKVVDRAGQLTDNQMVADLGISQDITANHVLPPTPGVIDMRKPHLGKLHQTVSNSVEMVDHPPALDMIHVADLGHKTRTGCVFHHVIGRPHHNPIVGTVPEVVKDKLSNAETTALGHVLILKDVRATLSSVADLVIGKEPPPTQVGPPAEMHQDSVHIVVDLTAIWHNAVFLRKENFLIGDVSCVLLCYYIELQLITSLLRIQGPPKQ
jgi:hypothetical protein